MESTNEEKLTEWNRQLRDLVESLEAENKKLKEINTGLMEFKEEALKKSAPWHDFGGGLICIGDLIVHPSGESGIVINGEGDIPEDKWRVDYGDGVISRLCLPRSLLK